MVNDTVDERIALLSLDKKNHRLFAKEQASIEALLEEDQGNTTRLDLGTTAAVPTGGGSRKGQGGLQSADSNSDLLSTGDGFDDLTRALFSVEDCRHVAKLQARAMELRVEESAHQAALTAAEDSEFERALVESAVFAFAGRLARQGDDNIDDGSTHVGDNTRAWCDTR